MNPHRAHARPLSTCLRLHALALLSGMTLMLSVHSSAMAQTPPIFIGAAGHGLEYFQCASESQTCLLGETRYVAYGAAGRFIFAVKGSSFLCNNASFNSDPAPGLIKACYFSFYAPLQTAAGTASEGRTGIFASGNVAYGANGSFNFIDLGNGATFDCTNATFGDPAPGATKACYVPASSAYFMRAVEGGTLQGLSFTPVAYGANGKFVYTILSGTLPCSNSTFGDPIPGPRKFCYTLREPYVASEGEPYNLSSGDFATVLYGSGRNGNFVFSRVRSGTCSNLVFGDPDFGVPKHCFGSTGFIR